MSSTCVVRHNVPGSARSNLGISSMEIKDWVISAITLLNTLVVGIGVIWAVILYRRQKIDAFEASKQQNRALLTSAYMKWHEAILASDDNIRMSSRLIRRSHNVLARGRERLDPDQCHAIHIMYMLLNVIYLEWTYRDTYLLSLSELDKTVEYSLRGLVDNPDSEIKDIADNFSVVFGDFPEEFNRYISGRLDSMRRSDAPIASVQNS